MDKFFTAVLIITLAVSAYSRNIVWHDAPTLWEDVIRKSPRKPRAYNDLGYYYFKQGMLDEALLRFQPTIIWNPNYAQGFCNIGAVYLKQGSFDQAIPYFERAVALAPKLDVAYFNLGLAYQSKGFSEKSREQFSRACDLGNQGACAALKRR